MLVFDVDVAVWFLQVQDMFGAIAATHSQILIAGIITNTEPIIGDCVPVFDFQRVVIKEFDNVESVEF